MTRPRLLVPAYFHPAVAPADWAALAVGPGEADLVVLNVDSGPGRAVEAEFARVAADLRPAGVGLLGYVDSAYGRRAHEVMLGEAARYREWYGTDGVFLDQAPSDASELPGHRRLTGALPGLIVCNHGVYPDPGYAEAADVLVTFEGPWAAYQASRVPEWAFRLPAARFCHLVYDVPPERLGDVRRRAVHGNAGMLYATDRTGANPYDRLPMGDSAGDIGR